MAPSSEMNTTPNWSALVLSNRAVLGTVGLSVITLAIRSPRASIGPAPYDRVAVVPNTSLPSCTTLTAVLNVVRFNSTVSAFFLLLVRAIV